MPLATVAFCNQQSECRWSCIVCIARRERDSVVVTEASVCYCESLKLPPPAALAVPLVVTRARAGLQEKCGKN